MNEKAVSKTSKVALEAFGDQTNGAVVQGNALICLKPKVK